MVRFARTLVLDLSLTPTLVYESSYCLVLLLLMVAVYLSRPWCTCRKLAWGRSENWYLSHCCSLLLHDPLEISSQSLPSFISFTCKSTDDVKGSLPLPSVSLPCLFSFCATHLSQANVCNQNLDILTSIAVWILHRSDFSPCNQRRTYFDLHQKWNEDRFNITHESIITSSWLPFNVSLCFCH